MVKRSNTDYAKRIRSAPSFAAYVQSAVENYVLGGMAPKIFGSLVDNYAKENAALDAAMDRLAASPMDDYGIRQELQCPQV